MPLRLHVRVKVASAPTIMLNKAGKFPVSPVVHGVCWRSQVLSLTVEASALPVSVVCQTRM